MNHRKPGYIKIGSFKKVPVLVHWSFVLGCLFLAMFFHVSRGEVIFFCGAYGGLIVFHEIGHAVVAHFLGLKVFSIELSGVGGICFSEAPQSRLAAFIYVSAGLIVQLILLVLSITYFYFIGWPTTVAGSSIAYVFTGVNSLLIFINIIPIKERRKNYGSDGYILWKLIIQLINRTPYGYPDTSATFSPKTSLLSIDGFIPHGFEVGIEIYNDNKTTMEFIVEILTKHLAVTREKAIEMMLMIHNRGGLLIPMDSYELAVKISSEIRDDAKRNVTVQPPPPVGEGWGGGDLINSRPYL